MRNAGLGSWPERRLRISPERDAIWFEGRTTSHAGFADRVRRAAGALDALGVRRGDRVAWTGGNHPSALETLYACGQLGAIWVPVNARLTAPEAQYVLEHSGASLVVHGREHGELADALRDVVPTWVAAEPPVDGGSASLPYEEPLAGAAVEQRDEVVTLDDPCLVMYTSGSTGRLLLRRPDDARRDVPAAGVRHPRPLPAAYDRRRRGSAAVAHPADVARPGDHDAAGLRHDRGGARLHRAGLRRRRPQGRVGGEAAVLHRRPGGATGRHRRRCRRGRRGRRGRGLRPERDGRLLGRPAAHRRGAAGRLVPHRRRRLAGRRGLLYIRDRYQDMIISGGENVYPAEVESALLELPGIAEAAVIGVPDEKWGEAGLALLVALPGARTDPEAVRTALRERLAGFPVPRHVRFVDALPKTATGKIRKPDLRARYTELEETPA